MSGETDDAPYFLSFVERTMALGLVVDGCLAIGMGLDIRSSCDAPLKIWIPIAICLSFPYTYLIHILKQRLPIKHVRLLEIIGFFAAFAWSGVGSYYIFNSQTCYSTAPFMYWTVYSTTLFAWTVLVTTSVLILWFAIWMTVMGPGEDDPQTNLKPKDN